MSVWIYAALRTVEVRVHSSDGQHTRTGWLQAYRLPPEQANQARRRAKRSASKKGRTPKKEPLLLAGWVLVLTTLSPAVLPGETILKLDRLRWQVEVAIKRWKSLLDVDQLRARAGSPLAEVWLHGKLLYALMLERRTRRTLGAQGTRLDSERTGTWWRGWKRMVSEVGPRITGALFWSADAWQEALTVVSERRRRRRLQRLPTEAIQWLDTISTAVHNRSKAVASWRTL
jgi:hypothetical protein